MSNTHQVQKVILVPVDFTTKSDTAIEFAALYAKKLNYKITLLHIFTKEAAKSSLDADSNKEAFEEQLKKRAAALQQEHEIPFDTEVRDGEVYKTIGNTADILRAAFVVMGIVSHKEKNKIFTSRAMKVVETCPVPLIVVQEQAEIKPLANLLFTAGMSAQVRQKAHWSAVLASAFKAKVHLFKFREGNQEDSYRLKMVVQQIGEYFTKHNIEHMAFTADEDMKYGDQVIKYAHMADCNLITIMVTQNKFFNFSYGDYDETLMFNRFHIPIMLINPKYYDKVVPPSFF